MKLVLSVFGVKISLVTSQRGRFCGLCFTYLPHLRQMCSQCHIALPLCFSGASQYMHS